MENHIARLGEQDYYPVSFLQKKEFFSSLIKPAYHFNTSIPIPFSNIDEGLLEKVISSLIERHESLRSIFAVVDGMVMQKVYERKHPDFEIECIDLIDAPNKGELFTSYHKSSSERLFDFQKGPLLDVKLIKLTKQDTILIISVPHAFCDGLSLKILHEEISLLYNSYKEGKPNPLKPLTIQYKEYAFWRNNWLEGSHFIESKLFYEKRIGESISKEKAQGVKAQFERSYKQDLENEIAYTAGQEKVNLYAEAIGLIGKIRNVPGGNYNFFMGKGLVDKLKKLAGETGTTLFPVLLASFGVLFYRISGKKYFRIDVPAVTRDLEEFQRIVGWLMGGMIVCFEVDGEASLSTLIKSVKSSMLDTYHHRYYPGERILKDFDLPINAISPLQLNLVKTTNQLSEEFSPFHEDVTDAYYNIGCGIREYKNGMTFSIIYNKSIYKYREIEGMAKAYMNMIDSEDFELENTIDQLL